MTDVGHEGRAASRPLWGDRGRGWASGAPGDVPRNAEVAMSWRSALRSDGICQSRQAALATRHRSMWRRSTRRCDLFMGISYRITRQKASVSSLAGQSARSRRRRPAEGSPGRPGEPREPREPPPTQAEAQRTQFVAPASAGQHRNRGIRRPLQAACSDITRVPPVRWTSARAGVLVGATATRRRPPGRRRPDRERARRVGPVWPGRARSRWRAASRSAAPMSAGR